MVVINILKFKRKRSIYILLFLFIITLFYEPEILFAKEERYNYKEIEQNAFNFLKAKLVTKEGGIYSNYYTDYYPLNPDDGQNHEILSESIGLYLEYLYLSKRKREFQKEVNFLKKYLLRSFDLISWKIDEKGKPENSSATIDDLRIVRYLMLAGKSWGKTPYIYLAKKIGNANLRYCTQDGILLDGASWEKSLFRPKIYKNLNTGVTLSYIDLYTLELLAETDTDNSDEWQELFDNGLLIIYHGYEDDHFLPKYNTKKERYIKKKQEDYEIINLTTILHLAEIGLSPIYAINSFDPEDTVMEDVASYALLVRIFLRLEDTESASYFLSKMLKFVIPKGPQKGGFGYYIKNKKRYKVYAFDNLLALTALREFQISAKER